MSDDEVSKLFGNYVVFPTLVVLFHFPTLFFTRCDLGGLVELWLFAFSLADGTALMTGAAEIFAPVALSLVCFV